MLFLCAYQLSGITALAMLMPCRCRRLRLCSGHALRYAAGKNALLAIAFVRMCMTGILGQLAHQCASLIIAHLQMDMPFPLLLTADQDRLRLITRIRMYMGRSRLRLG